MITTDDLVKVTSFETLVKVLRDQLDWPIPEDYEFGDVTYEYEAKELGLKADQIATVREFHQLRPLTTNQPWGIFFVSFDVKGLPVTVMRRILRSLVLTKRADAKDANRAAWQRNDLLFISAHGKGGARELSFAHFADGKEMGDLPILRVLNWNRDDTVRHNQYVTEMLNKRLHWPDDPNDLATWRSSWAGAFEIGYQETIRTAKDMSVSLAILARQIRKHANELLSAETESGSMRQLHKAFRENLIKDLSEDDFADMFAQTISYGLLAARISRPEGLVVDNLADMIPPTNPFLRELFATFLKLGGRDKRKDMDFDELGVRDVVDMLNRANMEAVLRDFGDRNPKEDPVIHFYELFLKEYDAQKRMQRGVFYTPRPVVNFIVRGVDEVLRTEFGLPLGLADTTTWGELAARNSNITVPDHIDSNQPFVQILDPATGTGTFLVEVVDLIYKRMVETWSVAGKSKHEIEVLWRSYVPNHLLPRLTAFELMMAPYAIAHMKLGLKLHETGYKFKDDVRARIFLTNSLQPPRKPGDQAALFGDALAHEGQVADAAKATTPFTAIVGNPPYAGHSKNNKIEWIVERVHDYKKSWPDLLKPGQGKWLQDDYVKFMRLGQHQLDSTGFGVLGFVTNHSFLDNPTFKGMRSRFVDSFGDIRILDLHGNVKKKERAPDGSPDDGVFEDVAQGVCITLAIKGPTKKSPPQLLRDDLFGSIEEKLDFLALPTSRIHGRLTCSILPPEFFFFGFDVDRKAMWREFPSLPDLFSENGDPAPGIVTTQDEFAVSFTSEEQIEKVEWLAHSSTEAQARQRFRLCTQDQWNYATAKNRLARNEWKQSVTPLAYRPFDQRFTVYDKQVAVHLRDRVMRHMLNKENVGLSTVRATEISGGWEHLFVFDRIIQHHSVSLKEVNYLFPLWLEPTGVAERRRPNLDARLARTFGQKIGLHYDDGRSDGLSSSDQGDRKNATRLRDSWDGRGDLKKDYGPRDLFDWIYAVLHSRGYRAYFAEFLKSDFARVPRAGALPLFSALISLGRQLIGLHLLRAEEAPILKVPNIRFAGKGEPRVAKGYPKFENGKVLINASRWFEDVPRETWDFKIGGYQVLEKWLKDRAATGGQNPSTGRVLTEGDILHYRRVVIALTETRRLMVEIDRVIDQHGGWPGAFTGNTEQGGGR